MSAYSNLILLHKRNNSTYVIVINPKDDDACERKGGRLLSEVVSRAI